MKQTICALISIVAVSTAFAKETDLQTGTNAPTPLKIEDETKGPFKAPPPLSDKSTRTTGQGFWKFVAVTNLFPLPPEILASEIKAAHGTVVVDAERDIVYWGLKHIGWVAFSNKLSQSWVVKCDKAVAHGNLHGSDLLPRRGKLPLIVGADNEDGEIYLSDTSFEHIEKLGLPSETLYPIKNDPKYGAIREFRPTDAAFISEKEIYIVDGYGRAFFFRTTTSPFTYTGEIFGGKEFSKTPHGVTYDPREKTLIFSGRPEAALKRWDVRKRKWLESYGLPKSGANDSSVCDVDVWGDYLLAACLDGDKKSPGPIYVINMKTKKLVSTLRPDLDLGLNTVLHIHDVAWYWMKNGKTKELYVLFTNWNPGGIGALKLVSVE